MSFLAGWLMVFLIKYFQCLNSSKDYKTELPKTKHIFSSGTGAETEKENFLAKVKSCSHLEKKANSTGEHNSPLTRNHKTRQHVS